MKHTLLKPEKKKFVEMYQFDSILDFVEYCEDTPEHNISRSYQDNKWCGGTFEDALKQARTGNPELVQSMFEGVSELKNTLEAASPVEIRDVTGEYFDVADYLSGEPECFRRTDGEDGKKVVPVYANFAASSGVSPQTIRNRGAAIVALCDELSKRGYTVELRLLVSSAPFKIYSKKNGTTIYVTEIKVPTDPLDIDTAAFILANPLCLRRLFFAALERYQLDPKASEHNKVIEYTPEIQPGERGFFFASQVHPDVSFSNYYCIEDTKEHVLKMIERFNSGTCDMVFG